MPAYVIADIDVKDPAAYEHYKKGVGPTLDAPADAAAPAPVDF